MYLIKLPDEVREQLAALPSKALAAFAEAMVVLEVAPWGGDPYTGNGPTGTSARWPSVSTQRACWST